MSSSSRMLQLLSLLQTHRYWPGSELARRLEVSDRTLRRDVDRLRDLGYPVHAVGGGGGGRREWLQAAVGYRHAAASARRRGGGRDRGRTPGGRRGHGRGHRGDL